jgi:S-adenosylmethionine/arginine decarboxylase-like enzyme
MTLTDRLNVLLEAYSHHYNINGETQTEFGTYPATADFFVRDENYAFSKKAVISAFEQYEYAYFYTAEHLDEEGARTLLDNTLKAGMARIRPHKEHKYSYVTLVILADTITPEAKKLIQKTRFQKNFRLSLHGWMEYHIAALECSTQSFLSNPGGKGARKNLEQNFRSSAIKKGENS